MTNRFQIKIQDSVVNPTQAQFVHSCILQEMEDSAKNTGFRLDHDLDPAILENGALERILVDFFDGVYSLSAVDAGTRCVAMIMPDRPAASRTNNLPLYCQARILDKGDCKSEAALNLVEHVTGQHQDSCRLLYAERVSDSYGDRVEVRMGRSWNNLKEVTKLEDILFDL